MAPEIGEITLLEIESIATLETGEDTDLQTEEISDLSLEIALKTEEIPGTILESTLEIGIGIPLSLETSQGTDTAHLETERDTHPDLGSILEEGRNTLLILGLVLEPEIQHTTKETPLKIPTLEIPPEREEIVLGLGSREVATAEINLVLEIGPLTPLALKRETPLNRSTPLGTLLEIDTLV